MTPTRTYKIIDHFKAGKCVMVRHFDANRYRELITIGDLIGYINHEYEYDHSRFYTFRLINKKGRRG